MKTLFKIFLILILAAVTTEIFAKLRIFGVVPNLFLLWAFIHLNDNEAKSRLLVLSISSIYADLIYGLKFGYYFSAFLMIWFIMPQVFQTFVINHKSKSLLPLYVISITVFSSIWIKLLNVSLLYLRVETLITPPVSLTRILVQSLYNLALFYPLLLLYTWQKRILTNEKSI